jgi:hypothetical protein
LDRKHEGNDIGSDKVSSSNDIDPDKVSRDNCISRTIGNICHKPLILLFIITLGIFSLLLSIQMRIGVPYWDVFNYLNNALYFAGTEGGGVSIFFPPLIPLLTSLLFRMGYVSINAIFLVTGLIWILGVIGFYQLLKERFTPIQSFTGSIVFITLPVVFSWLVSGGIDIPGVVFSIWAMYFLIIGLENDSRFLYLVLPLTVVAILARYTSGLIILPILFYLFLNLENIRKIKDLKRIILGVLLELAVLGIGVLYFLFKLGATASIFNLVFAVVTATSTGAGDVAYNPNLLYYLQNLLKYISVGPLQGTYQQILNPSLGIPSILSYLVAFIITVGLSFYIYKGIKSKFNGNDSLSLKRINPLKSSLIMVLFLGFLISFYYKSLIISEILLISLLYTLYQFLFRGSSQGSNNRVRLDFLFLSWFGVFLVFHGILPFKVDRYFITMAPAFSYFLILGFVQFMELIDRLKPKDQLKPQELNPNNQLKPSELDPHDQIKPPRKFNLRKCGVYFIISLILLTSATATYIGHAPKKTFTVDIGNSSEWIKEYDPHYLDKNIRSDYPNAVSWYLKMDVLGAYPRFFNTTDQFNDYLKSNGVDYYIDSTSPTHPELGSYRMVKSFGVVVIYQRIE